MIFDPLTLPCGAVIPNRIAKAAMEENLADLGQLPGEAVIRLYRRWAAGGAGLLITGNVMVDARALTTPGGIVLEERTPLEPFRQWATSARSEGGQFWMQLNHPGRQTMADMGNEVLAPSAVSLDLGKHSSRFGVPRAINEREIDDVIARFAMAAARAQEAGFDGVQIHAAHGYLISQFLSPLTNHRADRWGGPLENRARLLVEIIGAVRALVRPSFAVGIKLNSADFQRGGFDAADARQVVTMIAERGIDLVELSGGSFESPAMQGSTTDARTLEREAYFQSFAINIKQIASMPVMMTGGVRRRAVAEAVVASGVDMVGIATAFVIDPDLPRRWRVAEAVAKPQTINWRDRILAAAAMSATMRRRLDRHGRSKSPGNPNPILSLIWDQRRRKKLLRRYRQWLASDGV